MQAVRRQVYLKLSSNLVFADNNDRSFPVELLGGSVT